MRVFQENSASDQNGSPTSVTSNNGNDTTSFTYNAMGRTIKTTLPDSSETHVSYTERGQTRATWGIMTTPQRNS